MILIKYKPSDFKRYCPDYSKRYDYEKYINSFHIARYLLTQNNHNVIEVDFDREDYINWLNKENIEDTYLSQQCWAGKIHKGGNNKQTKKCIICDISFMGRSDSKFCSNICRAKNYRNKQREKRKKERTLEAIKFAKFIGIEEPNNKIIDYINSKAKWQRDDLLSINPKHKNYKMVQKKYKKMGIERKIDLLISNYKYIFEKLLL